MRILSILLLLLCGYATNAQEWVNLKEQGAPFEEIQAAFEAEWEGKTIEKGQGHSIYKRWEQFIEPRVYGESADWTELSSFLKKAWEEKKATIAKGKPGLEKTNGNWTALGPQDWINSSYAPGNGRINVVAVNPLNSNEYFVGTPAGGMWKTSDNGNSWEPITDNLPSPGVSGIAIHPSNPDIMYIGTGDSDATDTYGLGVFKTTNGGADWETTGFIFDNDEESITKVLMHPNDPETIFASSTDGMWKTTDGGITWYSVLNGRVRDLEFHPENPDIIYAGRERFYVSTDGGENFDLVTSGLPSSNDIGRIAIGVTPADASMVYLLIADDADGGFLGVWRSTNNGEDFEERATTPNILSSSLEGSGSGGQGFYDLAIAVSPINEDNVFCGGVNLWESNNGGNSFDINAHWVYNTPGTEYVHADIHQLEFFGDDLFSASDGGLWRSTNYGNSFTNRSFGLEITQCYRIGVQLQDPNRVVLGSQDNGTMLKANNWYHVQGGDGMQCFFHPTDASKMYVSSQYGSLYRSDNFGDDFDWAAAGIDDDGAWTTPWELDINNPSVMYAGYQNMWRSTNGGVGWAQVTGDINATLRYIDISPVNSNRVYSGTYDQIYTTSNGGNTWTEMNTTPLPNIGISWIAASEFDASTVYVCLSGTSAERKVYRTTDNGDNWENISNNLPNVPFNTIVEDPNLEGSLYVGSDLGIYHKHPELANWQSFDAGLPMTIVNELEIHPTAGKIYAGTYGRGIWVSDLFELSAEAPVAEFSVDRFTGCSGSEFEFTDLSLDHYPEWNWTFEGATPASSNEQYPEVVFNAPGVYEVSLTVSNANGSSTETKTQLITIYEGASLQLPYSEGFEDVVELVLPNWETISTADPSDGWDINNEVSYEGNRSVSVQNAELDYLEEYEFASLPIDLGSVDTASISFYVSFAQRHEDNNDRLVLYTSSTCGATWSYRAQWIGDNNLSTAPPQSESYAPVDQNEWSQKVFELPGNDLIDSFRYKFRFENDQGNNIYLDNINIQSGTVTISEAELQSGKVTLFPNPSSSIVGMHLENVNLANNSVVQVMDATGRVVDEFTFSQQGLNLRWSINISHLSPGQYLLGFPMADGTMITKRLLVN